MKLCGGEKFLNSPRSPPPNLAKISLHLLLSLIYVIIRNLVLNTENISEFLTWSQNLEELNFSVRAIASAITFILLPRYTMNEARDSYVVFVIP